MAEMPTEQGIVDVVQDALVALTTLKMQTEIDEDDASRVTTCKVGPMQDDPTAVIVLIHENDPDAPEDWPHFQYNAPTLSAAGRAIGLSRRVGPGVTLGTEQVGGGSMMARAFTAELQVWADVLSGFNATRRQLGQLTGIVESRFKYELRTAGPRIGTGGAVSDDFGESVFMGPYFGEYWIDRGEGESLITYKRVRFYYLTHEEWNA